MKRYMVVVLTVVLLLQAEKIHNTEIDGIFNMPTRQQPNHKDQPVKFVSSILSTETDEPFCSASIISIHFLTSSCMVCLSSFGRPIPSEDIKVAVPELPEVNVCGISLRIYEVQHISLHPWCIVDDSYNMKHDIGIIQTAEEIQFHASVHPARLPDRSNYHFDATEELRISTLQTRHTAVTNLSQALWHFNVKTMPAEECSEILNATYFDPNGAFCTSYCHKGTTGRCKTDNGAPLSSNNTLVGILIHKIACGLAYSAASFVNVTLHSNWIREKVQELSRNQESV